MFLRTPVMISLLILQHLTPYIIYYSIETTLPILHLHTLTQDWCVHMFVYHAGWKLMQWERAEHVRYLYT